MDGIELIKSNVADVIRSIYNSDVGEVMVERPNDDKWGDYSTNIAFILAKEVKQPPLEIAKNVCYELNNLDFSFQKDGERYPVFQSIDFASPGFINFSFSPIFLLNKLAEIVKAGESFGKNGSFRTQKVLVEYTDPNPFKVFHIGHLMSNTIGESISRVLEFEGADLKRANYQGDVGIHVAKSIWGMRKKLLDDNISLQDIEKLTLLDRADFLGEAYTIGDVAYDKDSQIKSDIDRLNFVIYKVAQDYLIKKEGWEPQVDYGKLINDKGNDEDVDKIDQIRRLYENGRQWSLEYFESIYKRLGTKFDYYYFESHAAEVGYKIVQEFLDKGVFEKDEGAVILRGEKSGLHTRVFVNSQGIPVYEAKELGLAPMKYEDFKYDLSLVVTGNEITEYFKVLLKALEFVDPKLASMTKHVPHGMLRLSSGKMSSRTGRIVTGDVLLDDMKDAVLSRMGLSESDVPGESADEVADKLAVGAIKYDVLKRGIGRDIIFDEEESISLTGNTGVYIQYTHARASSVLKKAQDEGKKVSRDSFFVNKHYSGSVNKKELDVIRHLVRFPQVVLVAADELSPSDICGHLFELAQLFNAFYNDLRIINAESELEIDARLHLTSAVKNVLKVGLFLLGIEAPSKV